MADVSTLVAALNTDGFYIFVAPALIEPDPSLGNDDQFAFQASSGKLWLKAGGGWVYQGIYKAFKIRGVYDNAVTYSEGDVVALSGSSYVWISATPAFGHAPPDAIYWQLLAAKGDIGDTGPQGASYGGTSTTSLALGTGAKAFATQAGLAYQNGARVRASATSDSAKWMEGVATYAGTTLTIAVDKTNGAGAFASWNFNIVGQPGSGDLSSANNLSDLASAPEARQNIGALSEFAAMAAAKAYGAPVRFPSGEAFGFVSSAEMSAGASTSATLDIMNGQISPTMALGAQIPQAAGSAIGGYTSGGGLAAAFDGATNQNDTASGVSATATTQYVGKDYTGAPKQIAAATFYPSNQSG